MERSRTEQARERRRTSREFDLLNRDIPLDRNEKARVCDPSGLESVEINRRGSVDRRSNPTPMLSRHTVWGRRENIRRVEDKNRFLYVDRYNVGLFLILLALLLLGLADALFTLYHVYVNEAEELNPIMAFFLGISPRVFFYVKYVLTGLCLLVLCLHKNLPLAKYLLGTVFLIYLIIVASHVYLYWAIS